MTLTERFAEWNAGLEQAPAEVRRAAKWHILDAIGVGLAAARLGVVDFAVAEAMSYGAPEESGVIGYSTRHPAPMAALANGALIHGLDFDDTHAAAILHGSAAVLPPVLAVSEVVDADLDAAADAFVVGLETAIRISAAAPRKFHLRGFHATSVVGIFGAALAAARLLGLETSAAVNAMGLAGSQASGCLEFLYTGASTKPFHPGWAGLAAVMAARLAARGAAGPATVLEGERGLYRAYADASVDPDRVTASLGGEWETTRMTVKPYPVCQYSHATLDALALFPADLQPGGIARIDISMPEASLTVVAEPREGRLRPRSASEAKFSVQWNAAALLIDGCLSVDHFREEQLAREDIRDLAARVHVHRRPFDGPPAEAPAEVTITMHGGAALTRSLTRSSADPERPQDDGALLDKFASNAADRIEDPARFAKLVLEDGGLPVRELMASTGGR